MPADQFLPGVVTQRLRERRVEVVGVLARGPRGLGGLLALVIVWMRVSGNAIARNFAKGYIFIFRGSPLLIQMFLIFYGLGQFGADVVLHSTTKYLGGHSDVVGGFAATNDPTIAERLRFLQKSLGAIPGPFDCWLVLRGVKTLAVRMERHCQNARRVAAFLAERLGADRVLYPGLATHPGHEIAARQMRDFGGMISFLAGSEEEAIALAARTKVWKLAESLGGVESMIEQPARMTHASTADAPFAVPRDLVRLSVGIESAEDLVADLEQALTPAAAPMRPA